MANTSYTSNENTVIITSTAVKRLAKDVKEIMKSPLTCNGIHYVHNESDMLRGQTLIIGPSDTPYERGYYFFDFYFPKDYPHKPPDVKYRTNDSVTRFNPNLYKNGKVCVSVLNTWHGDQWTGCQTISSILLTLCTLLNNTPLLNEPGVTKRHRDYNNYNEIITYKNFEVAITGMLDSEDIQTKFVELYKIMCADFIENYDTIIRLLNKKKTENKYVTTSLYGMNIFINYEDIEIGFKRIYKYLSKVYKPKLQK